jgi:1-acyl-sn-glycerol-3-phosphate acyltransferase
LIATSSQPPSATPAPPESPPIALAVAAIRSVTAYVVVAIYVLIVGPPGILLALALKSARILFTLGHAGAELGLRVAGLRYRVEGLDRVPRDRAVVYCPNHESNIDPPLVFRALAGAHPHLRVLYKAEMRKLPVLGLVMQLVGFIPVERRRREQAIAAVELAVKALRHGHAFLIFPEGTRSRTADLLPFKKGAFVLAIKAGAPIVPVALVGARAAMPKGSAIIRPRTIRVRVGIPIETDGLSFEDRDRLMERTRREIEQLRHLEGRGAAPGA